MLLTSSALCLLVFAVPVAAAPRAQGTSLGYDLSLLPGERLLGYRWDGGAAVPFLAGDASLHVEFGERGLCPGARLYLPAHALAESSASGASEIASIDLALDDHGRFGRALRYGPTSFQRLYLAPQANASGWSASFWLRPEPSAFGRSLVLLPGAVEVALLGGGRVQASLLPAGEYVTSTRTLVPGQWSYVVVAHDPSVTRQLRLFVDGEAVRTPLSPLASPRVPDSVQTGDLARNGQGPSFALDELCVEPFPLSTAQAEASWRRVPRTGAHLLEMFTTHGLRSAAPAADMAPALVLDSDAELAAGSLQGVVVSGGSLVWAPGRWRDLAPGLAPPARTTHPLVSIGRQRVLTFGGETRDTRYGPMLNTDDTWIFAGERNAWERVPAGPAPSPRCHVPAAYSPDHDLVLLVGGWKNDTTPGATYADTWVFDVGARRWEQRFPSGSAMWPGSDWGLVYLPALQSFLLMHRDGNALYDPVANRWQRLPVARAVTESGAPSTYRQGASAMCAVHPSTGLVVVFGGSSGPNQMTFSDTTALYDVRTNTYTVLATTAQPSPRVRSGFAYDPSRGYFVLFGGVRDQFSQRHDDLWVFDPSSRHWHELACSGRPAPRGGYYGMAYDEGADRFVLYGGRSTPERWLDDTLALELNPTLAGRALYTLDRAQTGRNTWFAERTEPGNSKVRFFFRAGSDNARWTSWSGNTVGLERERYLQVAVMLYPGSAGEVPSVQRMGLR